MDNYVLRYLEARLQYYGLEFHAQHAHDRHGVYLNVIHRPSNFAAQVFASAFEYEQLVHEARSAYLNAIVDRFVAEFQKRTQHTMYAGASTLSGEAGYYYGQYSGGGHWVNPYHQQPSIKCESCGQTDNVHHEKDWRGRCSVTLKAHEARLKKLHSHRLAQQNRLQTT